MQDQMAARTRLRCGTALLGPTGANGLAKRERGTRQVQVIGLIGQQRQALQHIGSCRVPDFVGQVIFDHVWTSLNGSAGSEWKYRGRANAGLRL